MTPKNAFLPLKWNFFKNWLFSSLLKMHQPNFKNNKKIHFRSILKLIPKLALNFRACANWICVKGRQCCHFNWGFWKSTKMLELCNNQGPPIVLKFLADTWYLSAHKFLMHFSKRKDFRKLVRIKWWILKINFYYLYHFNCFKLIFHHINFTLPSISRYMIKPWLILL